MNVFCYDIDRFCDLEQDLCNLHSVAEDFEGIAEEFRTIQGLFKDKYAELVEGDDYELPEWHHNIRMLWVYLYCDTFYDRSFIKNIQEILHKMTTQWFAQFECYSPSIESPESPSGSIGVFMIYKDSIVFSHDEQWESFRQKMGV